ncbi:unnamed protein product [Chondrus crispus]|uniref:Uncharacterized protein n=1 Tax=Chondrus crispus TaxID=2769 RepID=R7QE41_CHOCR|nr:unnamed protein product [Chondrus crispus]CDF35998.1 unnamed protein product [Chondrus crispus]|eukprot:XP_005715817.1 unnamed protein product [Chondrus crispus]
MHIEGPHYSNTSSSFAFVELQGVRLGHVHARGGVAVPSMLHGSADRPDSVPFPRSGTMGWHYSKNYSNVLPILVKNSIKTGRGKGKTRGKSFVRTGPEVRAVTARTSETTSLQCELNLTWQQQ